MKYRILILPVAAAVIIGLVVWRMNRHPQGVGSRATPTAVRHLAPRFELYDQNSQLVKFERYLGRTRLLLLFTGDTPAAELMATRIRVPDSQKLAIAVRSAIAPGGMAR